MLVWFQRKHVLYHYCAHLEIWNFLNAIVSYECPSERYECPLAVHSPLILEGMNAQTLIPIIIIVIIIRRYECLSDRYECPLAVYSPLILEATSARRSYPSSSSSSSSWGMNARVTGMSAHYQYIHSSSLRVWVLRRSYPSSLSSSSSGGMNAWVTGMNAH